MIQVKVPATSANLGPGFDSLGVALTLYNVISLREQDTVEIVARHGAAIRRDRSNLIFQTVEKLYERCGKRLPGLYLEEDSWIPKTRGLGSSSACIVAGLLGANALLGDPFSRAELLDIAAQAEGHPDNVTPALCGGITVAAVANGHVRYARLPTPELTFYALIPNFALRTEQARAALPDTVSRADACFNIARAALLTAAFASGDYKNLDLALEDRLHQHYRFALIPDGESIVAELYQRGAMGTYLSGAGPTLIALGDAAFGEKITPWLYERYPAWRLEALRCDPRGAYIFSSSEGEEKQ